MGALGLWLNIYLQVHGRQVPHEEEEPLERNRQHNSETHTGLGIALVPTRQNGILTQKAESITVRRVFP